MREDRTIDVEASDVQMVADSSSCDIISGGNKQMEEEFSLLVGETFRLTQCPRGLFHRKGKGIEAAAVRQLVSCMITHWTKPEILR
jgi:hypothetical protein